MSDIVVGGINDDLLFLVVHMSISFYVVDVWSFDHHRGDL